MNFLRKLRRNSTSTTNSLSYLAYGIGEIILVVIGILIAVSLNNWNEAKKSKKELLNIYSIVKADLENDLADIDRVMEFHETTAHLYRKVLTDSLTREDYSKYPRAPFLILGYPEVSFDKRGLNLLSEFRTNSDHVQDSLASRIVDFYTERLLEIKVDDDFRAKDFEDNYFHWKNTYPWWYSFISRTNIDGFLEYALNDVDYKNRVANAYFLTYDVFLPELKAFKAQAEEIIIEIESRQ
ncbi:MAG: hypothetical protein BalsKO_09220 [Balneolaceae bacterium]